MVRTVVSKIKLLWLLRLSDGWGFMVKVGLRLFFSGSPVWQWQFSEGSCLGEGTCPTV